MRADILVFRLVREGVSGSEVTGVSDLYGPRHLSTRGVNHCLVQIIAHRRRYSEVDSCGRCERGIDCPLRRSNTVRSARACRSVTSLPRCAPAIGKCPPSIFVNVSTATSPMNVCKERTLHTQELRKRASAGWHMKVKDTHGFRRLSTLR